MSNFVKLLENQEIIRKFFKRILTFYVKDVKINAQ